MAKNLSNGCYYSELWVHPKNWRTVSTQKSLNLNWYVECKFYDPAYKDKYPKGFPFRRRLNRLRSLEDRKAGAELLLVEIPKLLENKLYNPITKKYMVDLSRNNSITNGISESTPFIEALQFAHRKMDVSKGTLDEIRYMLGHFSTSAEILKLDHLPISEVKRRHLKEVIDEIEARKGKFSNHKFNKYRTGLSQLFTELEEYEVAVNIVRGIRKRSVEKKSRQILTKDERILINNILKVELPEFWLFMVLYFHSGGRIVELMRLKIQDVDLDRQVYKTLIKKRKNPTWVERPIKDIAVAHWRKAIFGGRPTDFVFSVGLVPGENQIRREQITRRWNMHVKKKLGITADFASLKHSNLDEITEILSAKDAAAAAGHTSESMVLKHYAVGESARQQTRLKAVGNEFA